MRLFLTELITCVLTLASRAYAEGNSICIVRIRIREVNVMSMIPGNLLFVLILLSWPWRINASEDGSGINDELIISEDPMVWNVSVSTQSQLEQFMENVTAYNDRRNTSCLHLSLDGDNNYMLDIVKLMNISLTNDGSLILESKGGPAEIDCIASQSDVKKLKEVVRPISRASLVLMDGLVISGCPVPLMIEEASNVTIQNCVFQ